MQRSKTGGWLRRILLIAGLLIAVTVIQYLLNRLFADRSAVRVQSLPVSGNVAAQTFDGTLRLATFNIAHGRGTNEGNWSRAEDRSARLQAIAELLRRQEVDIAVLNEVDLAAWWTGHENQAQIIARKAGFAHVVEQRNFDVSLPFFRLRFGNAILSRYPVASAEFVKLPVRSKREQGLAGAKHGVVADIRLNEKQTIRLFAVHLEYRDEETRARSTEVIAARTKESPYPFVCLGDFNSLPNVFAEGQNAGKRWAMEVLLEGGSMRTMPTSQPTPDQLTFSSFSPHISIDWIFIPSAWEFSKFEVHDVQLSDHRPVFADVRIR
jgi:endonuclease/exonuclease/phosphatase family metal-dependent hydrolase